MTLSLSLPAVTHTARATPASRFRFFLKAIKSRIDRVGLPTRLNRMSERQLKDVGLQRADSDWLRCQGSSEEAATRLAIRAGVRAGSW